AAMANGTPPAAKPAIAAAPADRSTTRRPNSLTSSVICVSLSLRWDLTRAPGASSPVRKRQHLVRHLCAQIGYIPRRQRSALGCKTGGDIVGDRGDLVVGVRVTE